MIFLSTISQLDAKDLITYHPISGSAYWNERDQKWFKEGDGQYTSKRTCKIWNKTHAGKEITTRDSTGYIRPVILRQSIHLHRFIWFYMTGEWPIEVDHINGIRDDNRWSNLRNVTHLENMRNQKRPINNTTGIVGVATAKSKWRAYIEEGGKQRHLGTFSSFEEAVSARKKAEQEFGYL